jgi:hypothetical protein
VGEVDTTFCDAVRCKLSDLESRLIVVSPQVSVVLTQTSAFVDGGTAVRDSHDRVNVR